MGHRASVSLSYHQVLVIIDLLRNLLSLGRGAEVWQERMEGLVFGLDEN